MENLQKLRTCDLHGSVGHQENSELELRYKRSLFLVKDVERLEYLMFDALHHTHPRLLLLLAVPQVEGHRAVALADLAEKLPTGFHLEHVGQTSLLKYCRLGVLLLVLPVPSAEQHVHSVDLVLLELVDLPVLGLGEDKDQSVGPRPPPPQLT